MKNFSTELLPPISELLCSGGDERIIVNPETGVNAYGCKPYPDPDLLAYGSSTASVISSSGYDCASTLRSRLLGRLRKMPAATLYAQEMQAIRAELLNVCKLPASTQIIFSPSGTDAHAIAGQYIASGASQPSRIIMIEANETGRGVTAALQGQGFYGNGDNLAPEIISIAMRHATGNLRAINDIDTDVTQAVEMAITQHRRVLLVLIDCSKTGIIAPSLPCVLTLQQRYGHQLEILVDACQFRIAPSTLRAYLAQDCIVAITGSKFLGAPSFSAALLMSPILAKRWQSRPFPQALKSISVQSEWPSDWPGIHYLANNANFGLLLRWSIALHELKPFSALPPVFTTKIISEFARVIQNYLNQTNLLIALPSPPLERAPLITQPTWDALPTIFPFLLRHASDQQTLLNVKETRWVYQQLTASKLNLVPRCQLGQPVVCGQNATPEISALRLCLSTRLIVKAFTEADAGKTIINDALAVLDKTLLLISRLPKKSRL